MAWQNIQNGEALSSVRSKLNTLGASFNPEAFESQRTLLATNVQVSADGTAGIADPLMTSPGWYFKNSSDITDKINWYYVGNIQADPDMTADSVTNQFAIVDVRAGGSPYFIVYTAPEGAGDAAAWFRSRTVYAPVGYDLSAYIGQTVMLYWGDDPQESPSLPRVECVRDSFSSVGPEAGEEQVLFANISTSTSYPAGTYEFVVEQLGVTVASVEQISSLSAFSGVAAETPSVDYSDTHYIELDGVNDQITVLGTGMDALDYTSTWSVGIEIESVSAVNDSSYTTLFASGDVAITLRKGGSNWGIYCFGNGNSVCQANTWYAPSAGSKILIVCTGTKIEYWLDGVRRANMSMNTTHRNGSTVDPGTFHVGKGGTPTLYWTLNGWFGGLNNLMISNDAFGSNQVAEYFGTQDVSTHSYYSGDVYDFIPLGEQTYPSIAGLKGDATGILVNGTVDDFVER